MYALVMKIYKKWTHETNPWYLATYIQVELLRLYGEVNIATNDQQNIRYKHTASIENETLKLANKYYESQKKCKT